MTAIISRLMTRCRSCGVQTLQRHPEVAAALQKLSGRITADDMRRMNYAVDGEKKDAALVVKNFLAKPNFDVTLTSQSPAGGARP